MIRDKPDHPKLVKTFMVLVANHVITGEMLRKPAIKDLSSYLWVRMTAAVAANYLMGGMTLLPLPREWKKMGAVGSAGERM